jgi:hypothetical protein
MALPGFNDMVCPDPITPLYGVITSLLEYFIPYASGIACFMYVSAIADGTALPTTVLCYVNSSADVRQWPSPEMFCILVVSRIMIRRDLSLKKSDATVRAHYGMVTEIVLIPAIILLSYFISHFAVDGKVHRVPITVLYVVLPTTVRFSVLFCTIMNIVFANRHHRPPHLSPHCFLADDDLSPHNRPLFDDIFLVCYLFSSRPFYLK